MAIEEQANNASLTGGVTEIAENPNEIQVAGGGLKPLLGMLESIFKPKPKPKPLPKDVAKQTPTGIAESAILEKDNLSYGRTADYWAKQSLSPEGYKRWVKQNKQARVIKPADDIVIDNANKAISELTADAPIDKTKILIDKDTTQSLFNINKILKKDNKGGLDFNFEHLKTGDDVLNLIDGVSNIYKDPIKLAKRGIITNKETLANASDLLADELGLTKRLFKQGRGAVMNAEEMTAVRGLIIKSAERLHMLARKVASGDAGDALKFRRQLAIHAAIQMKAKAAQTEIARAMQAFNIPVGMRTEDLQLDAIASVLKESGGHDLAMKMAKGLVENAKEGGRKSINKYARDGWGSKTLKAWQEVYINGLLSYTSTAMKNFFATPVFQTYQLAEEVLAGTFGLVERSVRKYTPGLARSSVDDGVYLGNAFARMYGWSKSFKEAWLVAGKTWRTESAASFGQHIDNGEFKAISAAQFGSNNFWSTPIDYLGKIIRLPGRGLQTVDDFWKTIAQRGELHTQAYMAKRMSLANGDDMITANDNARMILIDPRAVNPQLDEIANYATLTSDAGKIGKLTTAIQSNFFGRLLLPFARVPTNAVLRTLERSPAGLLSPSFWKAMKAGPKARQQALARLTFGSATMYMFHEYATSGRVTGAYPKEREQQRMLPPGWQPYSLVFRDKSKIDANGNPVVDDVWKDADGDLLPLFDQYGLPNGPLKYVTYVGLEPIGAVLGISADVAERMRRTNDPKKAQHMAGVAVFSVLDYFQEMPFLQGIGDITSALEHDDVSYLTEGVFRNTLGPFPKPFGNLTSTLARSYGDNVATKATEITEYYSLEDVKKFKKIKLPSGEMVYEKTGTKYPPYEDVGKPKYGNFINNTLDGIWAKQTKDTFFFGDPDNEAIQYDVLGHPKVTNTARFDIRPGEAMWNLITPFDVKRGAAIEPWIKKIYQVGMPLSFSRDKLLGKIQLNDKQISDWTYLAKNVVGVKEKKFRRALKGLVIREEFSDLSVEERKNKIKNLENKFYKAAIERLIRIKGNEDLYEIYRNVTRVRDEYEPNIK